MRCPVCGDEYEDGVTRCVDCRVPLSASHQPVPAADALLGRFDPAAGHAVVRLLHERGITHDALPLEGDVEVVVDAHHRDELRAELALRWDELLDRLEAGDRAELLAGGGRLPGWRDAPEGAWVDRHGRLQVAPHPHEEAEEDARRVLGPGLLVLGVFVVLVAWYAGGGLRDLAVVVGLGLIVVGALLPR